MLVQARKRGNNAGFYCDAFELTVKHNLRHFERLNSRPHLVTQH